MLEKIKKELAENFQEGTEDILKGIIERIASIASNTSNREKHDEKLIPYIEEATLAEYNQRGAEGLLSRSEGSISSSFKEIIKEMRTNIICDGVRRIK